MPPCISLSLARSARRNPGVPSQRGIQGEGRGLPGISILHAGLSRQGLRLGASTHARKSLREP